MYCENKITYILQRTDTLYKLARYYKTTVSDIIALNPGINPYNLMIGDSIDICPGADFNNNEELSNARNAR